MNLEEKIDSINPMEYVSEDRALITQRKSSLRRQVTILNVQKDWVGHPATQEWLNHKREEIKRIEYKLTNEENLDQRERDRLFGEKRAHKDDLDLMGIDPMAKLAALEELVNGL